MVFSVFFLEKMTLGTFLCRSVMWSDTDSWKGPSFLFNLDPTWWSVFSIFGVLFHFWMASCVILLERTSLGTFICRCVKWSDTDSWKGPPTMFFIDPTCWSVFRNFWLLFHSQMASSVFFLKKMLIGTFICRCVTWNDTDSWKGPPTLFFVDPTCWLFFRIFGVFYDFWITSSVFFLEKCSLVHSCVAVSRGV